MEHTHHTAAFDINAPFSWGDFFSRLYTQDFMPHGHCYFWRNDILWLHVIADGMITVSYYMIPCVLLFFFLRRKTIPFSWMFLFFGAFIFLCGTTHLYNIITTWYPIYRIEGIVKLTTGIVSLVTAFLLIPLAPKIIKFPGIEKTVQNLSDKSEQLEQANLMLERFNRVAVGREQRIIQLKQEVNEWAMKMNQKPPYDLSYVKR